MKGSPALGNLGCKDGIRGFSAASRVVSLAASGTLLGHIHSATLICKPSRARKATLAEARGRVEATVSQEAVLQVADVRLAPVNASSPLSPTDQQPRASRKKSARGLRTEPQSAPESFTTHAPFQSSARPPSTVNGNPRPAEKEQAEPLLEPKLKRDRRPRRNAATSSDAVVSSSPTASCDEADAPAPPQTAESAHPGATPTAAASSKPARRRRRPARRSRGSDGGTSDNPSEAETNGGALAPEAGSLSVAGNGAAGRFPDLQPATTASMDATSSTDDAEGECGEAAVQAVLSGRPPGTATSSSAAEPVQPRTAHPPVDAAALRASAMPPVSSSSSSEEEEPAEVASEAARPASSAAAAGPVLGPKEEDGGMIMALAVAAAIAGASASPASAAGPVTPTSPAATAPQLPAAGGAEGALTGPADQHAMACSADAVADAVEGSVLEGSEGVAAPALEGAPGEVLGPSGTEEAGDDDIPDLESILAALDEEEVEEQEEAAVREQEEEEEELEDLESILAALDAEEEEETAAKEGEVEDLESILAALDAEDTAAAAAEADAAADEQGDELPGGSAAGQLALVPAPPGPPLRPGLTLAAPEADELDDMAMTISVLAAAAAANGGSGRAAHPAIQFNVPPRENFFRRTGTVEQRPVRRPPAVVAFRGDSLRELQALVDSVRGPTVIDLQGRVVTLRVGGERGSGDYQAAPAPTDRTGANSTTSSASISGSGSTTSSSPTIGSGSTTSSGSTSGSGTGTVSLVPVRALQIPGWSAVADVASERAKILAAGAADAAGAAAVPSGASSDVAFGSSSGKGFASSSSSSGCLFLRADDVTLLNGTLQLHRDCRVVVSGSRVTLRRVEIVDVEPSGWWRQANAMPGTALQSSALITVGHEAADGAQPRRGGLAPQASQPYYRQHAAPMWSAVGRSAGRGGAGEVGPSLDMDECRLLAGGRDRDLLRADGAGGLASGGAGDASVTVTARYCRLRGGSNAVVATLGSAVHLDCCVVEGYATAGVVAMESNVRAVGSRLLGAPGSIIGLQAVATSQVTALGCFFKGHASNVECMSGASVDLQGCVLARPDCRYGLTVHPSLTYGPSGVASLAGLTSSSAGCKVRLSDCELGHAVQVGGGSELHLERCTFALSPTPADAAACAVLPPRLASSPELAALLAAAVAAGGGSVGSVGAGAFAGSVAAQGSLRLVDCRVGSGGEGESAVVDAAGDASVHLSSSPGVLMRREGATR